jgi:hypothetical protein
MSTMEEASSAPAGTAPIDVDAGNPAMCLPPAGDRRD